LSRQVGPPSTQWMTWWASHHWGGRPQPGKVQPLSRQGAQGVFVAFQGPVGPDQGHQGASDGDDVAVVAGLGHLGQGGEGFFAFAGGQGVFDLVQLA
jgi:hypothetical protein